MKKYIEWEEVEREINAQYAAGHMDAETSADMLAHLRAADTIEGLSKLQASCRQVNWISVEERLPKEWWPVLALIRFSEEPPVQEVLWHIGNSKWRACWDGKMVESKVSHWMLLPEPPKEEQA